MIAFGGAILLVATLGWGLFRPDAPIRVAKETTYLTEPLAADSLPDYRAAMLAAMGPAPKPEENAAVEILQVMWPFDIEVADLPVVCKALGITDVAPPEPLQEAANQTGSEIYGLGHDPRPWKGSEFPAIETWLVAQSAALDRLVTAADRPRFWLPMPALLGSAPNVCNGLVPHVRCRDVANKLCCRAMWHAGAGRHDAAWRDIRAVYRLSRLLAVPTDVPPAGTFLMAPLGMSAMADATLTRGLLALPDLPAKILTEIRNDLDAIGPLPSPVDIVAGERLLAIDMIVFLNRMPDGRADRRQALERGLLVESSRPPLSWFEEMWYCFDAPDQAAARTSLDWNVALQRVNMYFDAAETAVGLPTHPARKAALQRLHGAHYWGPFGWSAAGHVLSGIGSRAHRSALIGDSVLTDLSGSLEFLVRTKASFDLARTAVALAAWKADRAGENARYPETLDALVPRYLTAVRLDPFTEKPFVYERRGEGYMLASMGNNGVYDGGDDRDGWIVGGEWQTENHDVDCGKTDIVLRMPTPALPPR